MTHELGTCQFCDGAAGPNSTICIGCAMNPKRRARFVRERERAAREEQLRANLEAVKDEDDE